MVGLHVIAWMFGCLVGLMLRFGRWTQRHTQDESTLTHWWAARKGSNLVAIGLSLLGCGVWIDGTLVRFFGLSDRVPVTLTVTPIAAAFVMYFGHWALSAVEQRAREKAAAPAAEEDE